MTTSGASEATSGVILKGVEVGGRWIGDYVCPCGCGHVITLEHQVRRRLGMQRVQHLKCGGHGMAGIPPCGWECWFAVDDTVDFPRWGAHPDRCSRCQGSIYVAEVSKATEMHDIVAWDTGEVLNPGIAEVWNWIIKQGRAMDKNFGRE